MPLKHDSVLCWPALVQEAILRRKAAKMSQRQHALRAGVSVPTLAAFERGDLGLSLAKAFAILRVVGMVDETTPETAQDRFVRENLVQWPGAGDASHGYCWADYWLEGPLKIVDGAGFDRILARMDRHYPVVAAPGVWQHRVSEGRALMVQNYREDHAPGLRPGIVFDLVLAVRMMAVIIAQGMMMGRALHKSARGPMMLHFRAHFGGLQGRQSGMLARPVAVDRIESYRAKEDEITLGADIPLDDLPGRIGLHMVPMVDRLYELFGISGQSSLFVDEEIHRFFAGGHKMQMAS